jgi:transketolase
VGESGGAPSPQRERELRALCARGRSLVLASVHGAGAGHVGGPLSAMEILVTLYFHVLQVDPARPRWPERDRFILSKGHSSIGLYAVLAMRGFLPESELATFDHLGSRLQGHPDMTALDGLDMSTGSLGQGLSAGLGMALGLRRQGLQSPVYVLLGDGECQEGQVWEAAHAASALGASGLVAVVDQNALPQFAWPGAGAGDPRRIDLAARFAAFGWETRSVDGHDVAALSRALTAGDRPLAVVARTVKGRGVSFMEDDFRWHARVPTPEELQLAAAELAREGSSDA